MNTFAQVADPVAADTDGWSGWNSSAIALVILMAVVILIGAVVYYYRGRAGRHEAGLAGPRGNRGVAGKSGDGINVTGNTDL